MLKILNYISSFLFYLVFMLILLVFHVLQIIAFRLFGYRAHKKVVDYMSGSIMLALRIVGARLSLKINDKIPPDRPLILISNHQSMFDIPAIGWYFRQHHPKYISKKELGKNIPSVSYNLRHGGSILIDRSNQRQALSEILQFGKYIEANKYAASIFPEGTRSRNGILKNFKPGGIQALIKTMPSALIVPFVIDGHSQLQQFGLFPLCFGTKIKYTVLNPIEPSGHSAEELVQKVEQLIKETLGQ